MTQVNTKRVGESLIVLADIVGVVSVGYERLHGVGKIAGLGEPPPQIRVFAVAECLIETTQTLERLPWHHDA